MKKSHIQYPRGERLYYAVAGVFVALMLILAIYPLYFVVIASFSTPNDVMLGKVYLWPVNFNVDSYRMVLKNANVWTSYGNTLIYTILGTGISLVGTMTAAFVFSRKGLIGSRVCMLSILFTMYFSGGLIPSYFNIKNLGMLDTIWAMVIPGAISGYNLIIARTYMQTNIPDALEEASVIDGCSPIRYYLQVVIPLSAPIIGVLCLYSVVGYWNSYYDALVYLKERGKYPLQLILREILVQSRISADDMTIDIDEAMEMLNLAESLKYSLIIVASFPMLVLYPFLQKFFVKGIMIGSIKG